MRFLFVDQILAFEKGKSATGTKVVTMSEDFLADHFPRFPVMPGVLQLEAISQVASWLGICQQRLQNERDLRRTRNHQIQGFCEARGPNDN